MRDLVVYYIIKYGHMMVKDVGSCSDMSVILLLTSCQLFVNSVRSSMFFIMSTLTHMVFFSNRSSIILRWLLSICLWYRSHVYRVWARPFHFLIFVCSRTAPCFRDLQFVMRLCTRFTTVVVLSCCNAACWKGCCSACVLSSRILKWSNVCLYSIWHN